MIAIVEAYKYGAFNVRNFFPNLVAGTIIGVITLPLSMAFAIASGAKPEQGIYTAIIAGLVVGLLGGTRFQISGPTGAFIVVLLSITTKFGIEGLQVATIMAGLILVVMGAIRLGNVIKFIPDPVIVGFTSGISIIIFFGEWPHFFGLSPLSPNIVYFHEKVITIFSALPNLDITTTFMGLLSIGVLLYSSKVKYINLLPAPLVAIIAALLIQYIFNFSSVATIGSVYGAIPQGLPDFHFPSFSLNEVFALAGPAFTIALLGAIESLLSAVIADGMMGTRHNSNQELIGQGIANVICPFFGGFASTGAIARTATSIRQGATSPLAAVIHSITLILILYFLAPLAYYIPLCTLGAILFVIAYNIGDFKHFYHLLRHAPKNDVLVLVSTFLLTIFTDLVIAVNVGVILAVLLFTQRMSQAVIVEQASEAHITKLLKTVAPPSLKPKDVLIYSIQGPFFFAAAEKLEHALAISREDPKILVFRLKGIPFMDITGLQTFYEIIEDLHARGITIILCEANVQVVKKVTKIGILSFVYQQRIFESLKEALSSIK
ncbi:MAG: hypothetical protein ACD_16C00247G0003 [uncultured bacterium]|nr:MAG: hypothetical protein ACD_16C00247G0003 [uncultured bacterium]OFW69915.1 MAG: sodium-independent anion transporter [Alphaproteobacteria bacterium GWC2_42_16]OFW74531.1 MAG: sodium-independent anion transporter [Alphaproteobacteria bacterium GWA2_41_27]OFW84570.1 MAG: sodium-independent anion transporter [Alphaproteobacteria bacterium RBG_16_42_14]OFW84605.1 MAG: sodium-independent anion transporter [Alphaproteobacteria bacterium RIFCSPHIGHO2_12_FULL_42_100]OFW91293.1 MAG: sodium-indepen